MVILLIGALILSLLSLGLWLMTVKSQTPKRVSSQRKPELPYEEIIITSEHANLKGWFIPAQGQKDTQSPLIILVHGWGSSKSRMLRYITPLNEAGYALLLFDIRNHGESEGIKALSVKTFRDDCIAAAQYAQQRKDINPHRIGVLAHSFGGFGSILANTKQLDIKALVTDSMPARLRTIMAAALKEYKLPYIPLGPIIAKLMFFRAGISGKEQAGLNVRQALSQQRSPVLLVHSKYDHYVPPTELDYLVESQEFDHDRIGYLYVESNGHRSSETDPRFWEHVIPFFKKHV